jgi:RND family efflux transporter MFP subunit
VSQAEAGVGRAAGEYERWNSEHERFKVLAARGSVTPKLAEETLNQFRAAEASRAEAGANVESASAELQETQANALKSRADLVAARARVRVAAATLKQARTLLGYAEIKAPFAGTVTRRGVDTGHYVPSGNGGTAHPLLVVARTDRVRIFVDVPEMEAPLVDAGDPAVVRVQSLRGRAIEAAVTRTSWSLHPSNRSIRTEIDIPNDHGLLRPGMYATVTIRLEERKDALALPITAILQDGSTSYCCSVESGRVQRTPIVLGLRSGNEVEVVSGLNGNETIVLAQADSLQPGQQVEVIEAQK